MGVGIDLGLSPMPTTLPSLPSCFGPASLPSPDEDVYGGSQLAPGPIVGGGSLGLDLAGTGVPPLATYMAMPPPRDDSAIFLPQALLPPLVASPRQPDGLVHPSAPIPTAYNTGETSYGRRLPETSPYQGSGPSRRVAKKRNERKYSPYSTPSLTPASSISSLPPSAPSTPAPQSPCASLSAKLLGLKVSRPRTVQVDPRLPPPPDAAARIQAGKCPYCNFVPEKSHSNGLSRHIKSHMAKPLDWVCCGVPLFDAVTKHGLTQDQVDGYIRTGRCMGYNGRVMVGGCGKAFNTRSDALKRHLDRGTCPGDHNAEWLLGNQARRPTSA